ncbi:AraC family transcriptional regulator [Catenulispora subtropica]|uniref:helix-turn-helix domain-containing protein n=1 Tax=Catenulispora subtropica TaxID=450798 RepID=UPI0031D0A32B
MEPVRRIEVVRHRAHPALRGLVAGVVGMSELSPVPVHRRQPAGSLVPLVLSFGDPLEIEGVAHDSFVAGLSTGCTATCFERGQDCVQVYLTPVGISRLLGVPGREVAGRAVAVGDLVPSWRGVADRLASARSWAERFAAVESLLLESARRTDPVPEWMAGMCRDITASGGTVRIGDLVSESGWSHRYVARMFGGRIGLTPKQLAGVIRFERAALELGRRPLAEIAAVHGYSDQSHLTRDVIRYADETPTRLAAANRPTAHTALAGR